VNARGVPWFGAGNAMASVPQQPPRSDRSDGFAHVPTLTSSIFEASSPLSKIDVEFFISAPRAIRPAQGKRSSWRGLSIRFRAEAPNFQHCRKARKNWTVPSFLDKPDTYNKPLC
jgi:hypothetical protein